MADPAYPRQVEGEPASGVMAAGAPGRRAQRYNFAGLPFTREEADAIAACLGKDRVTLLTGAGATEKRFDGEPLASYRIIHLAAHSVIDERHPQISAVVLALDDDSREDGFLTIRELYGLELDADLVVLSACRSSGGEAVRGEGPVALARPFLTAGASAAVVTLWPVSDRSTAAFMAAFYRGLARGLDPVAALAGARRALLASDRPAWRLPFHWAPFVLVGRY